METKFTKGKWFACCQKTKPHFLFTENGDTVICSFKKEQEMRDDLSDDEFRANALLISKAPEMYKRLENNILILQNTLSYFNNIRKYINACDVHKFKNNYKLIEDEKNKIEQLLKEATEL